jgi:uncharacterized membrane protein
MQEPLDEQVNSEKKKNRLPLGVQFFISMLLLAAGALFLSYYMWERGYFASGYDTWGHLFKSDLMYRNIKNGNYYPLFTNLWYNGVQPYRYWAPLPYYILAGLQFLAKGDVTTSYFYFVAFSYFVGGFGWLLWGKSSRRMLLCTFIGMMWFFLPDNMRVFFYEGNVPRMVTTILLPYLVYFIWRFIQHEKNYAAVFITLLTALLALTHLMISAMMGVGAFIFLVFHVFETRKILRSVEVIISMLLGYVVAGIWIVPALIGGLVAMNSDASKSVMESLTYSLQATLNPLIRMFGVTDTYYFGLSIILICILGIFLSNKKAKAGYYTNLLILLCTTPMMIPFLSKLPLSQLFWMMRFTTIAYVFFFWSFIEWKNARRYFTLLLMILLMIDCIPSFMISKYYYQAKGIIADEVEVAKEITTQRVSLMDLSILNSYPSWELCEGENATQYTFGWAWQGASTASNIVMLNTSLEKGNYEYMFDRCLELGNDTVIVLKQLVTKINETKEHLVEAAGESNYYLYSETTEAYIFHLDVTGNFAVKTHYRGFGIGKDVEQIVFPYPTFIGESVNLEDYTIEALSQYETLYLSGFEYYNLENAEKMVTTLADMGVRVIIDMSHIPLVEENKRMYFLGVVAQDIEFSNMFPTITYKGEDLYLTKFPEEYATWNTKYIEGVDNVWGTADYYGQQLVFAGTNENSNIIFLGFNLLFYCTQTEDQNAYDILNDCFNVKLYELPEREIIPITVKYTSDTIVIDSPVENVNTTIAYQDNFVSDDNIRSQNNLLFVTKKHTEIKLEYPYLKQGVAASAAGIIITIIFMFLIRFINKKADDRRSKNA